MFASLVLGGTAVFFSGDGVFPVEAGNLVLDETERPYLFAFSAPMRQILADIPRTVFHGALPARRRARAHGARHAFDGRDGGRLGPALGGRRAGHSAGALANPQ
ncbi:hypothetical protein [Amycolatopsis sp. MtRt-6]|uniref:hypothetical protein n=1 Tax=Amycolatopsis sp. MtRt-6 TaxID=2792782 RepID=UPI001A8D8330|nr:hypothetical protein [Amycolatopsis sp. MtRt-6]